MNKNVVIKSIIISTLFIACKSNQSLKNDSFQVDSLKSQSNKAAQAFIKGDLETLFKLTPPKMFETMGGKSGMTQLIRSAEEQMKAQGMSFERVTVGPPSKIYRGGKNLFAWVPETTVMKLEDGKMTVNSHLFAISPDNGLTWSFIDASPLTMENIKSFYPEFNDSLKLPGKQAPVFQKN